MQRWPYHQAIRLFFDSQRSLSSGHHFSRSRAIFGSATVLYVSVSKVTAIGRPHAWRGSPAIGASAAATAQVSPRIIRRSSLPSSTRSLGPLRPELIIRAVSFGVAGKAEPFTAPHTSRPQAV
jgi:hypothetical protein